MLPKNSPINIDEMNLRVKNLITLSTKRENSSKK